MCIHGGRSSKGHPGDFDLATSEGGLPLDLSIVSSVVQLYTVSDRPAKTGHLHTNYTPTLYRSFLSAGTKYLYSVTCLA